MSSKIRRQFFLGLFLAPKMKFCLTIRKYSIIEEHKSFKGFCGSKRLLDTYQYFNMIDGKKLSAMLPKSCNKSFNNEIVIPVKKIFWG